MNSDSDRLRTRQVDAPSLGARLVCLMVTVAAFIGLAGVSETRGDPSVEVVVNISGAVKDGPRHLAGAKIEIVDDNGLVIRQATSGVDGGYRVEGLRLTPGHFVVRASLTADPSLRRVERDFSLRTDQMGNEIRLSFTFDLSFGVRASPPGHPRSMPSPGPRAAPPPPTPAPPHPRAGEGPPRPPPRSAPGSRDGEGGSARNYIDEKVFYVTDRKRTGGSTPSDFFGGGRGDAVAYGTVDVSIPRDHRMGELEAPSMWKFEFRENPEKHVVLLRVTPQDIDHFYAGLSSLVGRSKSKEAFVFIHGYNVSFEDAARRTAQLAYDLGFDGAPILYSWPSQASAFQYTVDEANVEWTAFHLKTFLEEVASRSGAKTVHLIAHSMGNRALTAALRTIATETRTTPPPRFKQVVLAAPDIDSGVFRQLAQAIETTADRITLYASSKDEALAASKKVHGYARAGESGASIVIVPGIDTIDVSVVDTSLLGHCYYGDNKSILSDMVSLIREGLEPVKRGLKPASLGANAYWAFQP